MLETAKINSGVTLCESDAPYVWTCNGLAVETGGGAVLETGDGKWIKPA